MANVVGDSNEPGVAAVMGTASAFNAVRGISHAPNDGAIVGENDNTSDAAGPGVFGKSRGTGVWGESETWMGVFGFSASVTGGAGVMGKATGPGIIGESATWHGVYGETASTTGGAGVWGQGRGGGPGVVGVAANGTGVYGEGAPAGFFKGDVTVTGDLLLPGADYAEELTAGADEDVDSGMVVVLDEEGRVRACVKEYDDRVAGVVSGAGDVKPAIVLDRHAGGLPVALMGKLWTFADATKEPIRCGDQLTTSLKRGHAQRATDRERAFGAVIGKALTALPSGVGMVRVLVRAS